MSGTELKRIETETLLPAFFTKLPPEEQTAIIRSLVEQDVKLREELIRKVNQSRIAEHDLAILSDQVRRLDHDRKFYTVSKTTETGSGNININIKGGDPKFITPFLIAIVASILGLAAIFVLAGNN